LRAGGRQRKADEASAVFGHEVNSVGCGHLRGDDKIAFVLAIFRIDEHDHAPVLQFLDNFVRRGYG
jgi:hypothetical protein